MTVMQFCNRGKNVKNVTQKSLTFDTKDDVVRQKLTYTYLFSFNVISSKEMLLNDLHLLSVWKMANW